METNAQTSSVGKLCDKLCHNFDIKLTLVLIRKKPGGWCCGDMLINRSGKIIIEYINSIKWKLQSYFSIFRFWIAPNLRSIVTEIIWKFLSMGRSLLTAILFLRPRKPKNVKWFTMMRGIMFFQLSRCWKRGWKFQLGIRVLTLYSVSSRADSFWKLIWAGLT